MARALGWAAFGFGTISFSSAVHTAPQSQDLAARKAGSWCKPKRWHGSGSGAREVEEEARTQRALGFARRAHADAGHEWHVASCLELCCRLAHGLRRAGCSRPHAHTCLSVSMSVWSGPTLRRRSLPLMRTACAALLRPAPVAGRSHASWTCTASGVQTWPLWAGAPAPSPRLASGACMHGPVARPIGCGFDRLYYYACWCWWPLAWSPE